MNSIKSDPEILAQAARPEIHITTDMTAATDQGQEALLALPHAPVVFQRGRKLCLIARGVKAPKWLTRHPDAPIIQLASPARLQELASRAASWLRFDKRAREGDEWQPALPPSWFVPTLQGRPAWPFPVLEGIVSTPILRPDGSVLSTQGYDADTGLYLDTQGIAFPPLLGRPTRDDAVKGLRALYGVLQDFPFVGSGRAAAVASLLTLVNRHSVQGNVPLFAVRSTVRGSGKGLLIDAVSTIATGRIAPHWPQSDDDAEDRKRLLTVAMAGDACIHIDNVKYPLGSPALDLALTAPSFKDRILGTNTEVEAPLTMVWFASGNGMQFRGDTARRVVPIDLDPRMERPEERTGFAYPRLLDHITWARPALVWAALTIVQAYCEAGKPTQGLSAYGSFQEWSDLIRSAVVWAGEADPCEGRKDLEAQSDPAFDRLASLLECWHTCYGERATFLNTAIQDTERAMTREQHAEKIAPPEEYTPNPEAIKWQELHNALSAFDSTYRGRQLNARLIGNTLTSVAGRVIAGKRFVRGKRGTAGYPWQVACSDVAYVAIHDPKPENVNKPCPGIGGKTATLATSLHSGTDFPVTNGSVLGEATFSPGRLLPDEAWEVLSGAHSDASEAPERPLTGSPMRISSPSPGENQELASAVAEAPPLDAAWCPVCRARTCQPHAKYGAVCYRCAWCAIPMTGAN